MSTHKSLYKTHYCRYFDERGRPLGSGCNQGGSCRFIHPDDINWTKPRRHSEFQKSYFKKPVAQRDLNSSADHKPLLPRLVPLVSQSDLFIRCNDHHDEATHEMRKRDKRSQQTDLGRMEITLSPIIDRKPHVHPNVKSHQETREKSSDQGEKVGRYNNISQYDTRAKSISDAGYKAITVSADSVNDVPLKPCKIAGKMEDPPDLKVPSQAVKEKFRQLSSLANEASQLTTSQIGESQKVKTYTELSATLSHISSSAAATVAPVLSELLINEAHYKQRVEETYTAIGTIWQEIFENISEDIDRVVSTRVDRLMEIARQEVHNRPVSSVKRQRSSTGFNDEERRQESQMRYSSRSDKNRYTTSHDYDGASGSYKRPRVQSMRHSSISSSHNSERLAKGDRDTKVETNILKEMQLKIEEQAKALETLCRENNELKTALQKESIESSS